MSTVMAIWPRQRRSSSLTKISSGAWWRGATSASFVPSAPERNTAPFSQRFEKAMAPGDKPEHQQLRDDLFLPGVPEFYVRQRLSVAGGNEIGSGKFAHPESSAALAVN